MKISPARGLQIVKNQGKAISSINAISEPLRTKLGKLTESLTSAMVGNEFNPSTMPHFIPASGGFNASILAIYNSEKKAGRAIGQRLARFAVGLWAIFGMVSDDGLKILLEIVDLVDDISEEFEPDA